MLNFKVLNSLADLGQNQSFQCLTPLEADVWVKRCDLSTLFFITFCGHLILQKITGILHETLLLQFG